VIRDTKPPRTLPPTPSSDDSGAEGASLPAIVFRKTCPICEGRGQVAFAKHGIPIAECAACSHRFADQAGGPEHIAAVYDDNYFEGEQGEYVAYEHEAQTLRERGLWYGRLLKRHLPQGRRILDVGAASGHILEGLQDAGWTGLGVEPNAMMAVRAQTRGIDVRVGTIEDLELGEAVDAITMIQVLQHVFDLRAAVRRARELTAPGGVLLIEAWDRQSVVARVLGPRWHAYNPPSVLHWLSKASLRQLLSEYGFAFLAVGKPLKNISATHAKSVLTRDTQSLFGRAVSATAALVPDGISLPYPGDDVFWMAFRKISAEH
jgi:SAM-dependent methyltransferase